MDTKLLANKELEDYKNEDSFDFLIKADAIKAFLEYNSTSLEKNKMLVLYGDWGSGKTSLMKHIESTINKNIYFPIFFHAWEHEKDENLPLSLCDALINSLDGDNDIIKTFMKGAFTTLKSFTSGITLKTSGVLSGLGLDIEVSGEKIVDAIEKAAKPSEPISFYKSNNEFKENFKKVERLILEKSKSQKILIFVDDLDRCEPENVLNLITALKLFFTYGEKTVFLSGIDKDAVNKAVKTRYKDVVKSEEYMEKVFDIAFTMPKTFSIRKMIAPHFFDSTLRLPNGNEFNCIDLIEDFFRSIRFTNPRHLQKMLNKYEIIKSFKTLSIIPKETRDLIPNIAEDDKEGKMFETILCLFMIVLYEFDNNFEIIEDYHQKMSNYIDILYNSRRKDNGNYNKRHALMELKSQIEFSNVRIITLSNIVEASQSTAHGAATYGFSKFLYIFSNGTPLEMDFMSDGELTSYVQNFPDSSYSSNFCRFLIKYKDDILSESSSSNYIIWNLFNMVKYLL